MFNISVFDVLISSSLFNNYSFNVNFCIVLAVLLWKLMCKGGAIRIFVLFSTHLFLSKYFMILKGMKLTHISL